MLELEAQVRRSGQDEYYDVCADILQFQVDPMCSGQNWLNEKRKRPRISGGHPIGEVRSGETRLPVLGTLTHPLVLKRALKSICRSCPSLGFALCACCVGGGVSAWSMRGAGRSSGLQGPDRPKIRRPGKSDLESQKTGDPIPRPILRFHPTHSTRLAARRHPNFNDSHDPSDAWFLGRAPIAAQESRVPVMVWGSSVLGFQGPGQGPRPASPGLALSS